MHDYTDEEIDQLYLDHLIEVAGARSGREILAAAGPEWLIPGWITSSATVVSGKPEVGKSTLVAGMAAAVARRERWQGEEVATTRKGPVLIIVTDPGDAAQWAAKEEDLAVPEGAWSIVVFDPGQWGTYQELAIYMDSPLVVFDNFSGAMEENAKDANPAPILRPLSRIVDRGTPVVAVAHAAKAGDSGPMGSTQFKAWRRHGLEVTLSGGSRKVKRTGNHGSFPTVTLGVSSEAGGARPLTTSVGSTGPEGEPTAARSKSEKKASDGVLIVELALQAPEGTRASVAQWIAEHPKGPGLSEGTIRNRLMKSNLNFANGRYQERH